MRIYALLVGIDDYPPGVRSLHGCVSDATRYHDYLKANFGKDELYVEMLTNGQATRDGIVRGFREHLIKAGPEDVVLFQYSGHGARSAAPTEFLRYAPDGMEEGLVCHDSRTPGKFDLADKEMAILLAEVARNNPHVTVIFDSCHSGSGTRSADQIIGAVPRFEKPADYKRGVADYLDHFYANQLDAGGISIPNSRHILLAGCENKQTAKEIDGAGIFTSTIFDVLKADSEGISYADLFVRARAAVKKRADDQNPQFETIGGFNANAGFLTTRARGSRPRFSVAFDQGAWKVDCGAIQGVPTDPTRQVGFALYQDNAAADAVPVGTATTMSVGASESRLALASGFTPEPGVTAYRAEMTSLPVAPMLVGFTGPAAHRAALAEVLDKDRASGAALADNGSPCDYTIDPVKTGAGDALMVVHRPTGRWVQGVPFVPADPAGGTADLVRMVKHVAQWHRGIALQNLATRMDPARFEVAFLENRDGQIVSHPPGEITLDFRDGKPVRGTLRVRNVAGEGALFVSRVYFSEEYGVRSQAMGKLDPVAATSDGGWLTLFDEGARFELPPGVNQSVETFMVIVSKQEISGFLLDQKALKMGEVVGATRSSFHEDDDDVAKPIDDDWLTVTVRLKVVRRVDVVGTSDVALPGGAITVLGHPAVTANLALTAATSNTRGTDDPDFFRAFERSGMVMVDLAAGTRSTAANANLLELTDIANAGSLADNPLKIVLDVALATDEAIVPLVFDGEFVRMGGYAHREADGSTIVSIDRIPETRENSRSVLGSLKLYFFKTVLKQGNVNALRWVDYGPGGTALRQEAGLRAKVADAGNILLLVHGIIGDTESMAAGVKAAGVADKFDLVLTYDYENLNTPIAETAKTLAQQLAGVGIGNGDDKKLTILAHSMGGLVSRWCIEQQGGKDFVDHLVMCGTPNSGSPFGHIDGARAIANLIADVALNKLPTVVPFAAAVRTVLKQAASVTDTLAQMNPGSQFLLELNASPDPQVPYTIIAGNIDAYNATEEPFFGRLLAAAGKGPLFDKLFGGLANDIAVGVESIGGVGGIRAAPPLRADVACHHLNYFACPAGHAALKAVAW